MTQHCCTDQIHWTSIGANTDVMKWIECRPDVTKTYNTYYFVVIGGIKL